MKRLAHAKRRDANEPEIVRVLRKFGATVVLLDNPVDLLVGYRGKNFLFEVKTENGSLNKKQKQFIEDWKGEAPNVVMSVSETIKVIRQ